MPLSQEEMNSWLAKHAAASAHLLEVIERWRGRRPLDPETRALHHQDHQAVVKEFEQFKEMPDEVWNLLDEPDEPNPTKKPKTRPTRRKK